MPPLALSFLAQMAVLLLRKLQCVEVGPPHKSPYQHPRRGRIAQKGADFGAFAVEALVGVPAPVGEYEKVPSAHLLDRRFEGSEVGGPVDEGPHMVPRCPCPAVRMSTIEQTRRVPSLERLEEPVACDHNGVIPLP